MNSTNLTQEIDRLGVSDRSSQKDVDVSEKDDDEEGPFLIISFDNTIVMMLIYCVTHKLTASLYQTKYTIRSPHVITRQHTLINNETNASMFTNNNVVLLKPVLVHLDGKALFNHSGNKELLFRPLFRMLWQKNASLFFCPRIRKRGEKQLLVALGPKLLFL